MAFVSFGQEFILWCKNSKKEGIYMYPLHSMRDYFSVVSGMVFGSIILKDCIGAKGMHLNRRTSGSFHQKRI